MLRQEKYLHYIAELYYSKFNDLGHAIPGHNGPHGHIDTAVRNTAHYLIIYLFLYKCYGIKKYFRLAIKFADYLCYMQAQSKSGAIQCMSTNKFDHLNGLIGQAWVIEALVYFYNYTKSEREIECAKNIFKSQHYNFDLHAWERIELDGTNIGVDITYNHQVWFLAIASQLHDYYPDLGIDKIAHDFLTEGIRRDFRVYSNGELYHAININEDFISLKKIIKIMATPIRKLNPKKLDIHYINKAYHIYDIYGFSMLYDRYGDLPFFTSPKYKKAVEHAKDINNYNERNNVNAYLKTGYDFNVYSYGYNSPAFELPYVAIKNGFDSDELNNYLYDIQERLMYDEQTGIMCLNNHDIETWNAKTYEIVRYLELKI